MPTQIKVPAVGESIKSVYVADWKKNTGDYCNAGDIICEIETDKASQEIPTEVAGVITTQANIGDELPIGGVLASIDEAGEAPAKSDEPAAAGSEPALGQAETPTPVEPPAPAEDKPLGQATEVLTTPSAKVHAEELGRAQARRVHFFSGVHAEAAMPSLCRRAFAQLRGFGSGQDLAKKQRKDRCGIQKGFAR